MARGPDAQIFNLFCSRLRVTAAGGIARGWRQNLPSNTAHLSQFEHFSPQGLHRMKFLHVFFRIGFQLLNLHLGGCNYEDVKVLIKNATV